ncbi:hypothetical protein T12_16902 [Trichinella patagoniensis]|uniref:Uncharacterized protein n=1 Tax=Trichinella patagoniensis TaxID=990121 RepID=A0A0V1A9E2_9BILA|nr:hypothetical protein T12_16902 [Trichinella patagoniensis]
MLFAAQIAIHGGWTAIWKLFSPKWRFSLFGYTGCWLVEIGNMAFGIAVLFSFHYMSRRCVHAVAQANRLTMYFRRIKIDLCNLNEAAEVMHMKVLIERGIFHKE